MNFVLMHDSALGLDVESQQCGDVEMLERHPYLVPLDKTTKRLSLRLSGDGGALAYCP